MASTPAAVVRLHEEPLQGNLARVAGQTIRSTHARGWSARQMNSATPAESCSGSPASRALSRFRRLTPRVISRSSRSLAFASPSAAALLCNRRSDVERSRSALCSSALEPQPRHRQPQPQPRLRQQLPASLSCLRFRRFSVTALTASVGRVTHRSRCGASVA